GDRRPPDRQQDPHGASHRPRHRPPAIIPSRSARGPEQAFFWPSPWNASCSGTQHMPPSPAPRKSHAHHGAHILAAAVVAFLLAVLYRGDQGPARPEPQVAPPPAVAPR